MSTELPTRFFVLAMWRYYAGDMGGAIMSIVKAVSHAGPCA